MLHFTTRCQHRCRHCYVDFERGNVIDMPDETIDLLLAKCAAASLLGNVTLLGGEPFIDPARLLRLIEKIWKKGGGTFEIFIPTNGRWVTRNDWREITAAIVRLAQWFPYFLRIAFSRNEWNLAELGNLAPLVLERWKTLETEFPETFYHRTLVKEELMPLGRALANDLAATASHVGVNCNFDDWYDADARGGFCTDYLAFYPDGSCGLCYIYHSPVIGNVNDDFQMLLRKRRDYLIALRERLTGDPFGILHPDACAFCKEFYPLWQSANWPE